MSALQREMLRNRIGGPGGLPPRMPFGSKSGLARRGQRDYTPLSWQGYFDSVRDIVIRDGDKFRVYLSGFDDDDGYGNKPLLLLLHGGGYSALTWSVFVKQIVQLCYCKVAAIDLRGHGSTNTANDDDLSATTLASDVASVCKEIVGEDDDQPVVLIGHSMGGAIAVHCAVSCRELIPSLAGLIVIDVVEGTALDALNSMQSVLRGRPKEFASIQKAIEWSVMSGQTKNLEAARVSMPGQLKTTDGTPATDIDHASSSSASSTSTDGTSNRANQIIEENETEESDVVADDKLPNKITGAAVESSGSAMQPPPSTRLIWRTDLTKSEQYWRGWFEGMSNLFLTAPAQAKMLLLAGIDRLDKTLTVGQMQGKFQMQVLQCGHAVHEDAPDKVAEVVTTFLIRNRLTQAKQDFTPTFPAC